MDRPYDDNEVLGLRDVDDGTPIPDGTGANAGPNAGSPTSRPRMASKTPSRSETFASGDQAAAGADQPRWLNDLQAGARREPMVAMAIAAAVGMVVGFALGR